MMWKLWKAFLKFVQMGKQGRWKLIRWDTNAWCDCVEIILVASLPSHLTSDSKTNPQFLPLFFLAYRFAHLEMLLLVGIQQMLWRRWRNMVPSTLPPFHIAWKKRLITLSIRGWDAEWIIMLFSSSLTLWS